MSANPVNNANAASANTAPQPNRSVAEAENLVRHRLAARGALVQTVEQETVLVRAGKVRDAMAMETAKQDLARLRRR